MNRIIVLLGCYNLIWSLTIAQVSSESVQLDLKQDQGEEMTSPDRSNDQNRAPCVGAACDATWDGSENSAWDNPDNWDIGFVPEGKVIIPDASTTPNDPNYNDAGVNCPAITELELQDDAVLSFGTPMDDVTLFFEDFESASGAENSLDGSTVIGWTNYTSSGSDNSWWILDNTRLTNVPGGSYAAAASDDPPATAGTMPQYASGTGNDASQVLYFTEMIDARTYTDLKLDFSYICQGEGGFLGADYDYGEVCYSADATSWTPFANSTEYRGTGTAVQSITDMDISEKNGEQFYIGFRWTNDDNSGGDPSFVVDDIRITGDITPTDPMEISGDLVIGDDVTVSDAYSSTVQQELSGAGNVISVGSGFSQTGVRWDVLDGAAYNVTSGTFVCQELLIQNATLTIDANQGVQSVTGIDIQNAGGVLTLGANSAVNCDDFHYDGTVNANSATITVSGNFEDVPNTGTFNAGTSTVILSSGGATDALTDPGEVVFNNLTVNRSDIFTLNNNIQVDGVLTLTAGNIVLGTSTLTLGSSASIAGGDASSYIATTGTGVVTYQDIDASDGTVSIPIGRSAYNPISIANSGTVDHFSFRVFDALNDDGSEVVSTALVGLVDNVTRTWDVSESTVGGSNVTLTLQWNAADEQAMFDRSAAKIGHYTGGAWESLTPLGPVGGADPYTLSAGGIKSFSPFGVGDDGSPLPVTWSNFFATPKEEHVLLNWSTSAEINNDYFQVERSMDGKNFGEIGNSITGAGNASIQMDYEYIDPNPLTGISYYRIKQVDYDGQYNYSSIQPVEYTKDTSDCKFSVYPNPVRENKIRIRYQEQCKVKGDLKIFDSAGRVVYTSTSVDWYNGSIYLKADLDPGIYYVKFSDEVIKILIE